MDAGFRREQFASESCVLINNLDVLFKTNGVAFFFFYLVTFIFFELKCSHHLEFFDWQEGVPILGENFHLLHLRLVFSWQNPESKIQR